MFWADVDAWTCSICVEVQAQLRTYDAESSLCSEQDSQLLLACVYSLGYWRSVEWLSFLQLCHPSVSQIR